MSDAQDNRPNQLQENNNKSQQNNRKSSQQNNRKSSHSNKSDIEQPQPNQQQHSQHSSPKRKLSEIQNQVESNSQSPQQQQKDLGLPKPQLQIQLPNRYSVYRETFNFNWNMKQFDINQVVEDFGKLNRYDELEDTDQEDFEKQKNQLKDDTIKLRVFKSNKQTTGLTKKTTYFITGRDKSGPFEITRYYHQFVLLRQKLLLRWPGCFIGPLPTKKFGNNPLQLVLIRMKFLNNFMKGLCSNPQIYYGEECQIFFKHDGDYVYTNNKLIEQQLQKFKAHSNDELLEKYKKVFSHIVEDMNEQQQKIAIEEIKELQEVLKSWKVDLTRFKDELRFLITSKDKYYQAMTRLSTVLLPEFESLILDWINDETINKQPLGSQTQPQKQGYLLNTQQYGSTLRDAALSVRNYNQSLWLIYDIFKFELKETDAILESIQSYEFLVREMDYLNRNLNINKDQLESLEQKKTTLKIFMMGGSVDDKRNRINKESQSFQQRLQVVKQLLNYVLNVLITSIDNFHNHRAETYKRLMAKSSHEQLVLVKKLMDFHIFELQTFRKKDTFTKATMNEIQTQEEIIEEESS